MEMELRYNIISGEIGSTEDNIIDPKIHYTVIGNSNVANALLEKLEEETPDRVFFIDVMNVKINSLENEVFKDDVDNTIQEMINTLQEIYGVDKTKWNINHIEEIRLAIEKILNLPKKY